MKARICDVCEKPIKQWKFVTYKERFIGCECTEYGVLPSNATRKVRVDMCKDCHEQFMEYLETCASVRKYKAEVHND